MRTRDIAKRYDHGVVLPATRNHPARRGEDKTGELILDQADTIWHFLDALECLGMEHDRNELQESRFASDAT